MKLKQRITITALALLLSSNVALACWGEPPDFGRQIRDGIPIPKPQPLPDPLPTLPGD